MAKIMKRTTAMVLALMLILGQVALPVIADDSAASAPPVTHDQVEAQLENMVATGTIDSITIEGVQEEIIVPEQGTQQAESDTTIKVEQGTSSEAATATSDPNAPLGSHEEKPTPSTVEFFTEDGTKLYDKEGKPLTDIYNADGQLVDLYDKDGNQISITTEGEVDYGDWTVVEGSEAAAETNEGTWGVGENPNWTANEEVFISGTYKVDGDVLKAEVTDQILVQTGLFTADDMTAYHNANPETTIDTLKGLINGKLDELNKNPDNIANGITWVLDVEPIDGTNESRIVIRKYVLTEAGEFVPVEGDPTVTNPDAAFTPDGDPVITHPGTVPAYEYSEMDEIVEKDADGKVTVYKKTENKGDKPEPETDPDEYDYTTTEKVITKTEEGEGDGKTIRYDVALTTVQNTKKTYDLQTALEKEIISQDDVDQIVADKNAALKEDTVTNRYYNNPTPNTQLTDVTWDAVSGGNVTVELNKQDANGKLTPKDEGFETESVTMPIQTVTGKNAEGFETTEIYTPAVLDGNLVYQRIASWVDGEGVPHQTVDYIYGELQIEKKTFSFQQNADETGSVVVRTTIETEQMQHVQASKSEQNFTQTLNGVKQHEGVNEGTATQWAFTVGSDGKIYFELDGVKKPITKDDSTVSNSLMSGTYGTNWKFSYQNEVGGGGYTISKNGETSTFRVFNVKCGNITRRVYCIEREVDATTGTDRTLVEPEEGMLLNNEGTKNTTNKVKDDINYPVELTDEMLDKLTVIVQNSYWADDDNQGLGVAKNTLKTYLTKLNEQIENSGSVDWLAGKDSAFQKDFQALLNDDGTIDVDAALKKLTENGATAATQWALWEVTYTKDIETGAPVDLSTYKLSTKSSAKENDFVIEALKRALVSLDAPARVTPVDAEITGVTYNSEVKDESGKNTVAYNADMLFKLDVQPSSLTEDVKIVVTGMNGAQSEFRLKLEDDTSNPGKKLMSWIGGTLDDLKGAQIVRADENGNFKLTGIQIAEGVTVSLTLSGTQKMGKGVVIYHDDKLQDFISLGDKVNNINMTMSMTFGSDPKGLTSYETADAERTDTKTVAYTQTNTRTDTSGYFSIVTDPGMETTDSEINVTVDGEVETLTLTGSLTKYFEPVEIPQNVTTVEEEGGPGGGIPMLLNLDIPDEPVPMVHEPGVGIPDEGVPLADAPATGDASLIWAAMSVVSMGGYVFLGKKEKKANKVGKFLKK